MSEPVKTGTPIELDLDLDFQEIGLFIRVILKNSQNVALSESPITLTDFGDGRYFDNSVIKKPGSVRALFEVFNDAGFTDKTDFEDTKERYVDPGSITVFGESLEIEIGEEDELNIDIGQDAAFDIDLNGEVLDIEIDENGLEINIEQDKALNIEIGDCP